MRAHHRRQHDLARAALAWAASGGYTPVLWGLAGIMLVYGGNGQTTFALPDLRIRIVIGAGSGVSLGEIDGENSTTITGSQLTVPRPLYGGVAVSPGQFDTWTPLGAEKMGNGYLAVWKHGAADEYTVWAIDGSGNWLSQSAVVPGSSAEIQSLEPGFNQNLNGVGGITARSVIESFGSTTLANVANVFMLSPTGSSLGPQIRMSGALVTVGQNGAWTPIAAEQGGGGYQVAWKNGAADEYIVWNLDGSGNWLSPGSVLSGASPELKAFENTFQQDLNLNGVMGAITSSMNSSNESTAEISLAGSEILNLALFTNYMASAFATPAGEGTGVVVDPQSSLQPFLAKPFA